MIGVVSMLPFIGLVGGLRMAAIYDRTCLFYTYDAVDNTPFVDFRGLAFIIKKNRSIVI